jgi:hypothetical protein
MPTAPDVNSPEYWYQRAKEARHVAERMTDQTTKQMMLGAAADCDWFAVRAAMRCIDELFVRRLINGS